MSRNQKKHDAYIEYLMKLIEKEEITFKDQYNIEHKVFNNKEDEFMYKESVYFTEYKEATLHNPYFPCAKIKDNIEDFNPYCKYEIGADKVLYENKCQDCMINAEENYYKRQSFLSKRVYIPDIGIGANDEFSYWIEIVNSHGCTEQKREFIKDKDFIVLELHIKQIEEIKNGVVECFNISDVSEQDYEKIVDEFKMNRKAMRGIESSIIQKQNPKVSKVKIDKEKLSLINQYIDDIFVSLGKDVMLSGQSLNYEKVIESIVVNCELDDISPYLNRIDTYLRKVCNCSILNLQGDGYPIELLELYRFSKRKSIVHSSISEKFLLEIKKYRRSRYL